MVTNRHIPGTASIAGELTKSTTQTKLVALSALNKLQTGREKSKDVLSIIHPSRKQYLDLADTTSLRRDLDKYIRKRSCVGSWGILEKVPLFLITCAISGQNQKGKF